MADSEFRLYGYILQRLSEVGWDRRTPSKGGHVYTQNEALEDSKLKSAFGSKRPENVVVVAAGEYWVIEAKSDVGDLAKAVQEARGRARAINGIEGASCRIITGIAGNPDTTHYIETHCLVGDHWERLSINNRDSTGFISPDQVRMVLTSGGAALHEYEIDDALFDAKTASINETLHQGGINKRNRARVLACLLLALAEDAELPVSTSLNVLIGDINNRASQMLKKHGKESFISEIAITPPLSPDNDDKHRMALAIAIETLRELNIASAINSGRDMLGQFYEQFLKYANDAKELGIVLTPRHITTFAARIVGVQRDDIVFDPACGTGGFLVAALDKVRQDGSDVDDFKTGNLHGIEQDQQIAALAIVNMIFRGDGSSNISEGDCFKKDVAVRPDKVLMNPPFALKDEYEWQFVDRALEVIKDDGLLFAVLPTTTMSSADDSRREITWRSQMLQRHTLIAVVKLPEQLFYPHVSKGTYGVVIKANRKHNWERDNVVWAILDDGLARTKTAKIHGGGQHACYLYSNSQLSCYSDDTSLCPARNRLLHDRRFSCRPLGFVPRKTHRHVSEALDFRCHGSYRKHRRRQASDRNRNPTKTERSILRNFPVIALHKESRKRQKRKAQNPARWDAPINHYV